MPRAMIFAALMALPLPAAAQTAAGAFGVTVAATAMEPPPRRLDESPGPEALRPRSTEDKLHALTAAAFRAQAKPARDAPTEPLNVEVRPPEGYDELEPFQLRGAKIAYARRF